MPLFSVLVPVYNVERYLKDCFDSIDAQGCEDFEVVFVDDGSTDGSGALCDAYAKTHINASVIHRGNGGLLAARRTAVEKAQGDYLVFLDSDDALAPDALSVCADIVRTHHPDVIAYGISHSPSFNSLDSLEIKERLYADGDLEVIKGIVCSGKFNNLCSKVVRRDLMREVGEVELPSVTFGEDWLQLLAITKRARTFYVSSRLLYFYRQTTGSSTKVYRRKHLDDLDKVFRALLDQSCEWGESCKLVANQAVADHLFGVMLLLWSTENDEVERIRELRRASKVASLCSARTSGKSSFSAWYHRAFLNLLATERLGVVALVLRAHLAVKRGMAFC